MPPPSPHRNYNQHPETVNHIFKEAQAHDINISRRQLEAILADTDPAEVKKWVRECLREEVLLGRDELRLWHHISPSPVKPSQSSQARSSFDYNDAGFPLRESNFHAATQSLNTATTALEAQLRVLKAQKRSFLRLVSSSQARERDERRERERLARKRGLEAQGVKFKIDDLYSEIEYTLKKHYKDTIPTRQKIAFELVTSTLQGDDRALEALNDTLSSLPPTTTSVRNTEDAKALNKHDMNDDDSHDKVEFARIEKLTTLLSHYTIEEITSRLDVIYLQDLLLSPPLSPFPTPVLEREIEESEEGLTIDLNSLHSEIPTVTSLYITSTFLSPFENAIRHRARTRKAKEQADLQDALDIIKTLARNLESLSRRIEGLRSYRGSLEKIWGALKNAKDEEESTAALRSTTGAGGGKEDMMSKDERMEAFLAYLDLPTTSTHSFQDVRKALQNRLRKAQLSAISLQTELYKPLEKELAKLKSIEEMLSDGVTKPSSASREGDSAGTSGRGKEGEEKEEGEEFGEQNNQKVLEARIGEMGARIEGTSSFLANLQTNGGGIEVRRARTKFVSRWGSQQDI